LADAIPILLEQEVMSDLKVQANSLLIFLDETGHEELRDPQYPVFGIGGCAVMGFAYDRFIRNPWKKMKADYFGGHDVALHATGMHSINKDQIEALSNFFLTNPFSRFCAIMKITTSIIGKTKLNPYQIVCGTVGKRIEKISIYYPFNSLVMIFESSDRTDFLAAENFGSMRALIDGEKIPVNKFRMNKSLREPGLEVADFIIHTAGSLVRNRMAGKQKWRKDFDCIFHNVDQRLVSYIEIDSVKQNE